jgi:hypothetical protein
MLDLRSDNLQRGTDMNSRPDLRRPGRIDKLPFTVLIAFLLIGQPAWAGKVDISLHFNGDNLAGEIKEAPLKDVLETIKKEKGIGYEGNPATLTTLISTKFNSLPLEKALQTLLAGINYSLMYDSQKKIKLISVIGKSTAAPKPLSPAPHAQQEKTLPLPKKGEIDQEKFRVIPNMPPPDNPNAKPIDTTVIQNMPPPDNPNAEMIDTTVIPDVAPPGAPKPGAPLPRNPGDIPKAKP